MTAMTKEEEYDLIRELIKTEKEIYELGIALNYCSTNAEQNENRIFETEKNEYLEKIKDSLSQIEDPIASREIYRHLIKIFNEMKTSITNSKYDFMISINKEKIDIENYFFLKISNIIKQVIDVDTCVFSKPFFSGTDSTEGIDSRLLISFLVSEINYLKGMSIVNYLTIREYNEYFKTRLKTLIE